MSEKNLQGDNQDPDSDDDEAYYENPVELIQEFGSHPLMQRAQRALLAQAKETQGKLQVQLLEKQEELKSFTQEREGLGVQLYGIQQQLAKLQIQLENAHNEYNGLVDARLQEEEIQRDIQKNNEEQRILISEYKKQMKKYGTELESLNETIRQIEKYNQEVKSEIAITRRAAYKTEQSMQQMEKLKENQDMYVDGLNKQIKQLQEQIQLYSSQFDSQKKETSEANSVLQETARELELIANEKKQLMIQWKAALSGLSRRDEALAQASQTLAHAESSVHDHDVQIDALKREIHKEQSRNETLVSVRDRLDNELQWVEENLAKIRAERDQLQERYTMLNKSLAQTDAESKKLDGVSKQLNTESEALLQNWQTVTQERQKLEEEMQLMHATKLNVSKAVDNLAKDQTKMLKRIHQWENEGNEIENEIARTKVDGLNCTALNDQLKEQHSIIAKELQDKEALVSKYQLEIRQRNDEIEKKMYRVDRLNKKYDKMVETAGGEENLGPMENIIRNLNKETDAISDECKELERDWLKRQTELVTVASESDQVSEQINEMNARVTILSQQQLRLTHDLRSTKTEVKIANQLNIDLQKDVTKLNSLIHDNHDQEGSLQHENFLLERNCVEELKDAERECVNLQAQINELKNSKASTLDEILDSERQALLWEKKIQLDKETRAALDPSVGQQEVQAMEKEVHRMTLRLDAIKREQEKLAGQMEQSIQKRSAIAMRFKTKEISGTGTGSSGVSGGGSKAGQTQELTVAGAKKRIADLKKDARVLAEETLKYSQAIEERKAQMQQLTAELESCTELYSSTEQASQRTQTDINDLLYQKQLNQERLAYHAKYSKKLKELSQTGVDLSQALQVERRLLAATQGLENIREILRDLEDSHPQMREVLQRVSVMADPGIDFDNILSFSSSTIQQ